MSRSRYAKMKILDGNHYESFTLEQSNQYKADTFDGIRTRQYTVKVGDRLDHLSARFLNNDEYWWVIALVNDLVSPFIIVGQKIKIPFEVQDVLDRL